MSLLGPVRVYIDSLLHPAARQDALTAARHRAFIAPRLLGSLAALAALPAYVALRGAPSALEALVFAWLIAPILIVLMLSRTGAYERAHILSSLSFAGLITAVGFATGGIGSFAAIWLVVVPLEAALSASRRAVALAAAFAIGGAAFLILMGLFDALPPALPLAHERTALAALGIIPAAIYATGLAFAAEALARTSVGLLSAEEDRYRLLARNMTDVISRHSSNGTVQFVSPAAEQLFGAPIGELIGHGLFERVHVGDRPAYLTALADAATSGESRSVTFRARRSQEPTFVWVEMCCRALDEGEAAGARSVVAVMRDVTERKSQEVVLEHAHAEAERANAAKSRFLATMSHELRTPLNAIIGFSEMLTNEESLVIDAERRREYAQLINDSGHHLLAVVNDILDMSKIESGNFEITPEPFAPAQVIRECCQLLAFRARDMGIMLAAELPDRLPDIVADKRALHQIMLNLISNAIKFTRSGGKVTVRAMADRAGLAVVVEDTGVGIGADDLPQIGNPFFQARSSYDRRHDGTGLGLSIVKGLLALHGGDMELASRLGEGTRVTIRLALDCEAARPASNVANLVPRDSAARGEHTDHRVRASA